MEEPSQVTDIMEWVERLGGWAVVILVVRWMMVRLDRTIETQRDAVEAFKAFEMEERKSHQEIILSLKDLRQEVRDLKPIVRKS